MDVTPTFYTRKGEPFVGEIFHMQPAEVKTVDLKTLMPLSIRHRRDWGGMSLSYTGGVLEMWAQLRLMKLNDGDSVDVTFSILQDKRSDIRNAVWWMPEHGEAIIAVGNLASSATRATLKFSDGDSEDVEVPAHGTHLIRKRSEQFQLRANGEGEAVTVSAPGSNGNIIVAGAVTAIGGSFSSSIRFYDTDKAAQPNLYATNFRLESVKPRMLLRNTGTQTISATPRFIPAPGDPNNFIDLPSVSLQPNEIADVDIEPLKAAVSGRPDFDHVSIQVLNTGSPGSLIGALNGKDMVSRMTYDVPLRDIGGLRNSTGAYPWRLDHDLSTVVSITNIAPTASGVVVQINYLDGPYLLDPQRLAPGETVVYDLRKIRDEQIPDRNGHTIPLSVNGGQFKWFIHGPGSGRLIGRAEMLSLSEGISSSYSCSGAGCPATFSYAYLDPDNVELAPGDYAIVHVKEIDCDAYGCYGPFSPWVTGWELFDPDFAILFYGNGSEADLLGFNGGEAYFQADIGYEEYVFDGLDCVDEGFGNASASGDADVVKVNWTTAHSLNGHDAAVPIASGTPPQGSSAFITSTTITAAGEPTGGTYSWSTSSNKVTLTNTNSATVTVTGVTESPNTRDVTITVTYTHNSHSASSPVPLTVQKPTFMDFVSVDGSGTNTSCASGRSGIFKDMTWQLADKNHNAIPFAIPIYDEFTNDTPNSCGAAAVGEGSAPGGATTGAGREGHHYTICSAACNNGGDCSVTGTQPYHANGFDITLSWTMTCSSITVASH